MDTTTTTATNHAAAPSPGKATRPCPFFFLLGRKGVSGRGGALYLGVVEENLGQGEHLNASKEEGRGLRHVPTSILRVLRLKELSTGPQYLDKRFPFGNSSKLTSSPMVNRIAQPKLTNVNTHARARAHA